jgi:adenylate cyclase
MVEKTKSEVEIEEVWRKMLLTGEFEKKRMTRYFFRALPGSPRCKACYVPFEGAGGYLSKHVFRRFPSNLNPQLCNTCEDFAKKYRGGVEIELSLLFADVRGSTALAEAMTPTEFSRLINRFYSTATNVLVHTNALIDKIIGDQAAGMYVPGFAGQEHACQAIEAAQEILQLTGHGSEGGPWIPLGVGVHTGTAFVGSLGSENGTTDITVLGDVANTAAHLSSNAKVGEILISEHAYHSAGYNGSGNLEQREVNLKGKTEGFLVNVMTDYSRVEL